MQHDFKILVIEDDPNVSSTLKDNIVERFANTLVEEEPDLNKAVEALERFNPDAVILDLIKGPVSSGDMAGNMGWKELWNHRFVPLIVYTASSQETDPPLPESHPFIGRISKGRANSVLEVMKKIENYLPYMKAVKELSDSISGDMHRVLIDTAPLLWQSDMSDSIRYQLFSRVLRRRIAASADATSIFLNQNQVHWEQYIFPPLETDLLMGDLLWEKDKTWENPNAYRIVLTPSCDLVRRNRKAKTDNILVARCVDLAVLWNKCRIAEPTSNNKEQKAMDHIASWLNDFIPRGGLMPLPDFPTILPHMAIDFRALEFIKYENIENYVGDSMEPPTYVRIVSIDSPFREALAWAYMHVACRPGLPDRETTKWAEIIIGAYKTMLNKNKEK